MDESRKQFEDWASSLGHNTSRDVRGLYVFSYTATAWISWKASREAIEIELLADKRRMDWLVSKAVNVRDPMVYGSHSMFWSQAITDEEDDYYETKLREQIDAAMDAEAIRAAGIKVKE